MRDPTILHISDIHRSPDEPVPNSEIVTWLRRDLESHSAEDIPRPDAVVVSGDITHSATEEQFSEAKDLLLELLEILKLPPKRLVVVPGNHDVHWETCENYTRIRRKPRNSVEKTFAYSIGNKYITYESEDDFQKRLQNFRNFYRDLFSVEYPALRAAAFTEHRLGDLGLIIVGLSSVDMVDSDRLDGNFNPDVVKKVAELDFGDAFPIATWHHDLDWEKGKRGHLTTDSLRLLSAANFRLGLCGHTHRPANNDVCRIQGYDLPVIAAGSLCASADARPESRGRSYNVVQVRRDRVRVWVRTKDERHSPWRDLSEFGDPKARTSWYDVRLAGDGSSVRGSSPRQRQSLRAPNPFQDVNAKQSQRLSVIRDYVWTTVANDIQIELPQIIVGTRGSGKTALLLNLTIKAQVDDGYDFETPLAVIGLFCQMRVNEVSALTASGTLSRDVRKELFRAAVSTMWSTEILNAIAYYNRHAQTLGRCGVPEREVTRVLKNAWGLESQSETLDDLRQVLRGLRNKVLDCIGKTGEEEFDGELAAIRRLPLLRGGPTALGDAAAELSRWRPFEGTRWTVLFDEVEFLNKLQQECIYEHISRPSKGTSCKIATLPYAHARALESFPSVLVLGDDYSELPVMLGEDRDFEQVAKGLWRSRLGQTNGLSLEEVWPEDLYLLVLSQHIPGIESEDDIDDMIIADLAESVQETARKLRAERPSAFGDQYRRKFREPFRFRIAKKAPGMPLYWGWRQMLKACGNNPRQFLRLASVCWNAYWLGGRVRPLTPDEQYRALSQWASTFADRCATLPHRGHELEAMVERLAERLGAALHTPPALKNEHLSVKIEDCAQQQAEAIAIGIAYGYLVPKMSLDGGGRPMFPSHDIAMRLGYPVAVAKELPLRQGEVLKIKTLRQLELPWWNE